MGGAGDVEPPSSCSGSRELQCVGKMEIETPKPAGFLCGSIPVLPDYGTNTALLPSSRLRVSAPRYRVLPTETDLNRPPVFSEKMLPPATLLSPSFPGPPGFSWGDGAISSNFSRRCETLAVSGLVEYGDEVDVIGPADMLKQIFKMPYSKARLSIVVHRIGRTLILNSGPDLEEGEELIKRHSGQSKRADQSLFLNFAMHSVRVEACDCPPLNDSAWSKEQGTSSVLPGNDASHIAGQHDNCTANEQLKPSSEYSNVREDGFLLGRQTGKRNKKQDAVKRASQVGEKTRGITQESERHRRLGNEGFMRVLFWQFHNFRMLLGCDLLLFSNEKHIAVSLHLWDVTRQVTPLTWLEAWLDNIIASVPEMAICYHQSGVVQGYELLKTEDIFLLKGISEDGSPAFNPHVVQQNGLSVLRFLQENCKQDPGAYWLYKGAGEEVIQLFDLAVMPKGHSDRCKDGSSRLPSPMHRGRSDSLFSLGTLLYRIGHRLSLSVTPKNRAKCASFIRKCLEIVDEPDQLVVRAFAHEQYARIMLTYDEDPAVFSCQLPEEISVTDAEEESLDFLVTPSESVIYKNLPYQVAGLKYEVENESEDKLLEATNKFGLREMAESLDGEKTFSRDECSNSANDNYLAICDSKNSAISTESVQTVADPISSKLSAIHHVSQAIKSLRWMRQLQSDDERMVHQLNAGPENVPSQNFSICGCGDPDCIEVCDIREWLPTSKLDHKLWKLVLLLGESYLALANAYKEEGQLFQTLKVVQLACSVYGSMPQYLEDAQFISSMACRSASLSKIKNRRQRGISTSNAVTDGIVSSDDKLYEQFSSTYLFWSKAWTLVGDVYVELHVMKGKELFLHSAKRKSVTDLRMSAEVVKEVKRLKNKLGRFMQNCSTCSLINCCCQSDRARSGSSASSSSGYTHADAYFRRHGKKSSGKGTSSLQLRDAENESAPYREEKGRSDGGASLNKCTISVKEASQLRKARSQGSINSDGGWDTNLHRVSAEVSDTNLPRGDMPRLQSGGIFQYIEGVADVDGIGHLLSSLNCYEQAKKALSGLPAGSVELQSISKKKGWVCNEIGRNMLEKRELTDAETAFSDAITAFREVSDHANIILICCNLGHGRRALAEDVVAKLGHLRSCPAFGDAYNQALATAKLEYCEAIKFYGAAKLELKNTEEGITTSLENDVYTQYAHTHLRLGMLLAKEDVTAEVYEKAAFPEMSTGGDCENTAQRKHEISANDAIREALSVYESLGDLRKQEAAYAHFQLASYQRDRCFKFLKSSHDTSPSKSEQSLLQRVKQYATLAEKNWQKAIDFYAPETHPSMFLTILIERSELSISLSGVLHTNSMMEASLSHLLEGRKISETALKALKADNPDVHSKFWSWLQNVLKKMLASALSAGQGKLPTSAVPRACDSLKLKELYRLSLKFSDFSQLHAMHSLWIS